MNKGEWKILMGALNVLDNLVVVDRVKYEARKRIGSREHRPKQKWPRKGISGTYTTTLEGKMYKINSGGGSPVA